MRYLKLLRGQFAGAWFSITARAAAGWIITVLCVTIVLNANVAHAQQEVPLSWRPLGGPGGRITHLAASADGAALFAVSVAGVNRHDDGTQWREGGRGARSDALYRSNDGGQTWFPGTNNLIPGPITALYADPLSGDLYAGVQGMGDSFTRRVGLWRSRDGGFSWTRVTLDLFDVNVWRIARSADGGALFVGATGAAKYPSSYVFRSNDDGRTWATIEALRYEERPGSILTDLTPHPTDPNRLFISTYGGDVYVSSDGGQSWSLAPLPTVTGPAFLAIGADAPYPLIVVRGREDGGLAVARSTDGGQTWEALDSAGLPNSVSIQALFVLSGDVFLLGTSSGTYRSVDSGRLWQPLEGALSNGEAAAFLPCPASVDGKCVLAATGYGLFRSDDAGALWRVMGQGLPHNSRINGLLTDERRPDQLFAVMGSEAVWGAANPPLLLRSLDAGVTWAPAAQGIPAGSLTAWAPAPDDPDTLFVAADEGFVRTTDGGVVWQVTPLPFGQRQTIAVAPSDSNTLYLGGNPALASIDGGVSWREMPVRLPGQAQQAADVVGLVVAPGDPRQLWAALRDLDVLESSDGGLTWRGAALTPRPARWLAPGGDVGSAGQAALFAGVAGDGVYRWDGRDRAWAHVSEGLPAGSDIVAFVVDPRTPGTLWAARDGGGLYRSSDNGALWVNMGQGVGDNLGISLAIDYTVPGGLLMGTATAGVWALRPNAAPSPPPARVDARIEVVWPHDWAPVTEAKFANLGLRLFEARSLEPPPCSWTPRVSLWEAVDTNPAQPLGPAEQRSVDGHRFPYWVLNDIDVSRANDPAHKLYFMVSVEGIEQTTSIWAHGADPRTFFPFQDVPSAVETGDIGAVDARIQIVWPHDEAGDERPVTESSYANVGVAFFKHGTRLSVPVGWQPAGVQLYGAWNQEVGQMLAGDATVAVRQAGAITYPIWEFDNIPVARATDPANKLYLWVKVVGVDTFPTIWTHGADARTFFPAQDEPIQGCLP